MTHARSLVFQSLRLLTLSAAVMFSVAHADEYSDVTGLMRAGKSQEAMAKVEQALASKPRDPQLRFLKGVLQRDSGKTSDAITTFSRLTEDYPELPEPYNNLAVLYAGQSQFDKARTALEMAIRTNPSYATAHENLGDVYAKLASQAYSKALQLDTANPAVPPKLALIRELFSHAPGKSGKAGPAAAAAPSPAAPAATPAASAPVASKPAAPVATPAAPAVAATAPTPAAKPSSAASNPAKEAEAAVNAWAAAWAAKDMKKYLGAYGKEFDPPGKLSRAAWEEERHQRITSKSKISVKLDKINVSVNGSKATVKFLQDYKANGLSVSSRKVLELVKTGEQWKIVKESVGS